MELVVEIEHEYSSAGFCLYSTRAHSSGYLALIQTSTQSCRDVGDVDFFLESARRETFRLDMHAIFLSLLKNINFASVS